MISSFRWARRYTLPHAWRKNTSKGLSFWSYRGANLSPWVCSLFWSPWCGGASMTLAPLTSGWKDVTRSSSWSAVHCGNESRWQTVCVAARACTRWWSPATRTLIRPSKPIVFCLFRLQREYRSAWGRRKKKRKTHHHTVKCRSLPKGSGWWGFIAAYSKTLSWILQKHVHLNKQAAGAKCPSWGSSKVCVDDFFCLW